jgi:hypothetical protein
MIDNETMDLVNAAIDGELSTEGIKRLAALRAERPEVASLYDETLAVTMMLQSSGSVDPPGYLKERILAALPTQTAPSRPVEQIRLERSGPSFIDTLKSLFQPQFALQLAAIFAGGLIIGGTLMQFASISGPMDSSQVTGTVGADAPAISGTPVAISGETVEGTATVIRNGSQVEVSFEGTANQPAEIEFVFPSEALIFTGFSSRKSFSGPQIAVIDGKVSTSLTGETSFSLTFDSTSDSQTQITIELTESNGITTSQELAVRND